MSLLTITQDACALLSLAKPLVVVTSTDLQVNLLYALAKEEGEELRKGGDTGHDWQVLIEEQTFVTVAEPAQAPAFPADFDHFIPDTFFNRTTTRQLIGPITVQEWQAIQAQPALSQVYLAFRERGGKFLITPTPPAGQTIAFEYLSKNWVQPAASTGGAMPAPTPTWASDTDTSLLNEHLIKLGVRWRFLKSKGLDYSEDFTTYQRQVEMAIARDGTARKLSLSGRHRYGIRANLPEGGFPAPAP